MLELLIVAGLIVLFLLANVGLGALYLFGAYRDRDRFLLALGALKLAVAAAFLIGLASDSARVHALGLAMLLLLAQALLVRVVKGRMADRPA